MICLDNIWNGKQNLILIKNVFKYTMKEKKILHNSSQKQGDWHTNEDMREHTLKHRSINTHLERTTK